MVNIATNRRIGARTPTRLPVSVRRAGTRRFGRRFPAIEATITNVSVTGLEIESASLGNLVVRDKLVVTIDDGTATVEIRRVEPARKKTVRYGLMILEADRDFTLAMNRVAVGLGHGDLDWRWDTAR